MKFFVTLALVLSCSISIFAQDELKTIRNENADKAVALFEQFKTFTVNTPCQPNDQACIDSSFAKCFTTLNDAGELVNVWSLDKCNAGLSCVVLPLVNSRGVSLVCATEQERLDRIAQARAA
ncbi:8614_t:CDS:2 [Funneliformis geosporum]|uniref:8614_t:CDS:1 n=1 Tax=Funneliformis geosporum TaxID=1117311 RepID=A0A9W4S9H2_9GLOM|nr:8614_t:CDS:2 [Funneliformis geosporum]